MHSSRCSAELTALATPPGTSLPLQSEFWAQLIVILWDAETVSGTHLFP